MTNFPFSIDDELIKLEKEGMEFTNYLEVKLNEINNESISEVDKKNKKIIYLEKLEKICSMLIDENKEEQINNMTKEIFSIIKYCIVGGITYIFSTAIAGKVTENLVKADFNAMITLLISIAIISSAVFIIPQKLAKNHYINRTRSASIRKMIIEVKLKELRN